MKKWVKLLLLCIMVVCMCTTAMASDLGLNSSNRKLGDGTGVTLRERNGTLAFGTGKLWLNFAKSTGANAAGQTAHEADELIKDFSENGKVQQLWNTGDSLLTEMRVDEQGHMYLKQTAEATGEGISSVSFTLQVPIEYEIIIPTWNGICLTEGNSSPFMTSLAYPRNWQAQMLLIQTTKGGLLIHAVDDGSQFKCLNIAQDESYFYLTIETIPQAPFTQYERFETCEWAFIPYEGSWQRGADIYKAFMNETFGLDEIIASKPEWAKDIELVCLMDIVDKNLVTELAKLVDPEKTLLHLVNWRTSNYDVNYPDYSVREGLKSGVDYAHELGFKVSVHANMIGAHLDNADYIEYNLQDAAVLDSKTLEQVIEGYLAYGMDYSFAQINQASTVWQDVLIEQLREIIEVVGVDVVHLDQSLLYFNDGRGLVNGMTTMQGNVELQRRLAEAYPDVVFSGEGINEFNTRYASLLQMHVYGLDNAFQSWNETWFDQILPITNYLFEEQVNVYHYPALPTTREEVEEYWQAWYRAGNQRANDITCLYRFNTTDILEPTLTGKLALWDANFRMENDPVLDESAWAEDVLGALIVIALIVTVAAAVWEYHIIHLPVKRMVEAFAQVEKGNYDVRLDSQQLDEFENLSDSFNHMVTTLQELVDQVYKNISQGIAIMRYELSFSYEAFEWYAFVCPLLYPRIFKEVASVATCVPHMDNQKIGIINCIPVGANNDDLSWNKFTIWNRKHNDEAAGIVPTASCI